MHMQIRTHRGKACAGADALGVIAMGIVLKSQHWLRFVLEFEVGMQDADTWKNYICGLIEKEEDHAKEGSEPEDTEAPVDAMQN